MLRMGTLAGALCLMLPIMGAAACDQRPPRTHMVAIEGMRFAPEVLTVAPGDTIAWANRDLVPHTATSQDGGFDSKDIPADGSWTYTARTTGDFTYVCTFHPTMKATLRVR